MHLVVTNQFYWPSIAATAQLLTDLCESVAARGHRVTVVCTQGDYVGGGDRLPARETHNGVEIRRVPATSFGKGSSVGRLSDYGSFYALAAAELLRVPSPDVYLALSTPPLIALAALTAARARRARFVYWCQDVYPDVAVALGAISEGGAIATVLDDASRQVLERADAVVAIGEQMAEVLRERGARRLHVIHNWADGRAIDPTRVDAASRATMREEMGARTSDLLLLYAGNLGRAHEFGGVKQAFDGLRDRPWLRMAFVGEGARKEELREAAKRAGVLEQGVVFRPYQPREKLGELLCAADAHLICLDPAAAGLVVPSKLYGTLASGRPTLLLGPAECEPARILHDVGAGERLDPVFGRGLLAALDSLREHPATGDEIGERARRHFAERFDIGVATQRFLSVLESRAAANITGRKA